MASIIHTANAHVSIPLGIVIGLFASFVQSLGLTIQRKSHILNQQLPEHHQRVEHRRPLWLLGFAIFFTSNVLGSFVQIASLPVVILAPLGAVSLLWNAFFARFLLGDVFSPWMILGTLLIAGGAVLIAVFGIVPEPTRSLEDLLELFSRPAFVAYFSLLGIVVFICLVITHVTEYSFSRRLAAAVSPELSPPHTPSSTLDLPANPSAPTTGVTDTVTETIITERTPLLDRKSPHSTPSPPPSLLYQKHPLDPTLRSINRTRLVLAISYSSFSGIISGMCLLFAKSGVELLLLTLRGQNQFWRWQAWVLVLGLVLFALLQLLYLHKALILADPTLVCPSAFCFYNLSSIVNGLVYFNQISLIPQLHLILVIVGIVVLLGGVWVVSIQSGGGGVDVGAWSDESDIAKESDVDASAGDAEPRDLEDGQGEGTVAIAVDVKEGATTRRGRGRGRIGPVPMRRVTMSESNVPTLSASPEASGYRLETESDRPVPPQSAISQPASRQHPPLTPERQSLLLHDSHASSTSLYSSARYPMSHRRRPTLDTYSYPSAHYHPRSRTTSHTQAHPHSSYTQVPPPLLPLTLNTVSTLGAGFQIGLSPLSPGFAIIPRERRRRLSALGAGFVFPDVVETAPRRGEQELERQRRRTVSEGDVRRKDLALVYSQRFGLDEGLGQGEDRTGQREHEQGEHEEEGGGINDGTNVRGKGKGTGKPEKGRWKWLKGVFSRRR